MKITRLMLIGCLSLGLLTACNSNSEHQSEEPEHSSVAKQEYSSADEIVDYFGVIASRMQDVKMMDDSIAQVTIGFHKQQINKSDALERIQQTYDFIDVLKESDKTQKIPYTKDSGANDFFNDTQSKLENLLDNEKQSADILKQSVETNDPLLVKQIAENRKTMISTMQDIQSLMNKFASSAKE